MIDEAIEILEDYGILFECSVGPGMFLGVTPSRKELYSNIEEHFKEKKCFIDESFISIPEKGDFFYYMANMSLLYEQNSSYDREEIIREYASKFYKVPKEKISFDFL